MSLKSSHQMDVREQLRFFRGGETGMGYDKNTQDQLFYIGNCYFNDFARGKTILML